MSGEPQFIQSTISEVIALAFEDKDEDVRAAAIRLLVNLSEEGMLIAVVYLMISPDMSVQTLSETESKHHCPNLCHFLKSTASGHRWLN
jgi:hypothetical protein